MESSDNGHLYRGVDNLQSSVCVNKVRVPVHDPVSCDGGVVVMRLLPHQIDAAGGSIY